MCWTCSGQDIITNKILVDNDKAQDVSKDRNGKKKKLPTKQVSWAQEQSHGGTHWGYQSIVSYWEAK